MLHLTVYSGSLDGSSVEFAECLAEVLRRAEPHFCFRPTALDPLLGRKGFGELRYSYDPALIADLIDNPPTVEEIDTADAGQRLAWIEQLAPALSATCPA